LGPSPIAVYSTIDSFATGEANLLLHHATFRTCDLEHARKYIGGVFVEHEVSYLSHRHQLDFRHRQARLGTIAINSMQYGAGVTVIAPPLGFYLLQFTLNGECSIQQDKQYVTLPTGSVAIVNPYRSYKKKWLPGTRQLLLRIDSQDIEHEFRALTGNNEPARIEFDLSPISDVTKIGTLTSYVRMLCHELRNEKSHLAHQPVSARMTSGLVSILLATMRYNKAQIVKRPGCSAAPFFVRRVERYIEEHASDQISLSDLVKVAGVSARTLQTSFSRFRNMSPMSYLRGVRLDLAYNEFARAGRRRIFISDVAYALGLGHLGRFARDYKARFGETPSQTLRRGRMG
jgi:AraC-like DNA-binding protein